MTELNNKDAVLAAILENPAIVYDDPSNLELLTDYLRELKGGITYDLSTQAGRSEVTKACSVITGLKSDIEKAGLAKTKDWRERTNAVNATKRKVGDCFVAIKDDLRKPLTDWENAQKARDARVTAFWETVNKDVYGSVTEIEAAISTLEGLALNDFEGDEKAYAQGAIDGAKSKATDALGKAKQAEQDAIELQELRAAKQAQEQAEADALAKANQETLIEQQVQERLAEERSAAIDKPAEVLKETEPRTNENATIPTLAREAGISIKLANHIVNLICAGRIPHIIMDIGA